MALRAIMLSINEMAGNDAVKDILNSVVLLLYVTNPIKKYDIYHTMISNMFMTHILICLFLLLYVNMATTEMVHVKSNSMNNILPEKSIEPSAAFNHKVYKLWSGMMVDETNLPIGRQRHAMPMMTAKRRYNVCLRCIISLLVFL